MSTVLIQPNQQKLLQKIASGIKNHKVEELNVESLKGEEFLSYDSYILSVPTWFDGELPNYWDGILPALGKLTRNR